MLKRYFFIITIMLFSFGIKNTFALSNLIEEFNKEIIIKESDIKNGIIEYEKKISLENFDESKLFKNIEVECFIEKYKRKEILKFELVSKNEVEELIDDENIKIKVVSYDADSIMLLDKLVKRENLLEELSGKKEDILIYLGLDKNTYFIENFELDDKVYYENGELCKDIIVKAKRKDRKLTCIYRAKKDISFYEDSVKDIIEVKKELSKKEFSLKKFMTGFSLVLILILAFFIFILFYLKRRKSSP